MGRDNREEEEEKPLGRCSVLTYGVGHMLNDITQCCWYTYLLLYLTDIGLSPSSAAIVTLVGQFADAFTTIIAGELIDRFGQFKIWHGAGCIMVGVSFISLFGGTCIPCKILGSDSPTVQTVGYCISAVVFCSGWSCTQISHMSMVNCITLNESSRIACVSCRNAFTMVASLMLYAVTFFVFTNNAEDIKTQYRWMAFISIFIGGVFVIIFHLGVKEPRKKDDDGHEKIGSNTPWTYWLKRVLYYQVASIYVFTRVVTNVSQTFLAVYVINDLRMSQSAKSLVPAIIYLCSFITSVLLQVTSIGMESALVDKHLDGSAFVYGSMGFIDKVLCGVALYFLESFEDADPVACNPAQACFSVTRFSLGFIPGIAALFGVIVSFTMKLLHTSHKKQPLAEPLLA
ncbi:PREDICTED: major facilitator superfamily domain-containing protein 12-like isoform X2 [Ipomoea nil]|uniref:major facilitator superfamily domain-containing protein 12-like isoform X2 n=1 Tax=Ipomoea nil TaxID=35883 RepID=UPI0009020061|nr:PREDICTED: major facilitator superfamily domain-containing protein 12-like isoform X2 [Ipomoea nil]